MTEIDRLYIRFSYYGSRKMTAALGRAAFTVNRKRVRRLMRLQFVGPRFNTSKEYPDNKVYSYLMRSLEINCLNQVQATDVTYIPMPRVLFYRIAIMDWFSPHILSWRLSNTLDTGLCIEALEEAMARYKKPEIFNRYQARQFTRTAFTGVITAAGVRISMNGRGRCIDNVFVERL